MSSRAVRVLQVGKFFPPVLGGMETYLGSLCAGLRDAVDLQVLVANTQPRTVRERHDGIALTRVASLGRVRSMSLAPGYAREMLRARADIVHLHAPNPIAELGALTALRRRPAKLVVTWHSDVVRQRVLGRVHRGLAQRVLARADAICVATPNHVRASAVLPAFAGKCRTATFGIDPARAEADPVQVAAIRALAAGRPLVLGAGRLVYYKGFEVLLEAIATLDATLLLVGEGERGPALAARIDALGLRRRALLIGAVRDVRPYFAACDVFVLPSTHTSEAFGIVQLEAMAFGKPVVSTRLGTGVEWVNQHDVTGLTVAPGDVAALRGAIARLLGDADLRTRLGANGRCRVEREFTTAQAVADVLAVYRELTGAALRPTEMRRVA